jgi:hypothetical protein
MYGMPVPPNVVLVPSSFDEIVKRIVDEDRLGLGFQANLTVPYKLTDYAPGWGKLYEEQLVGYTHWYNKMLEMVYFIHYFL